MVRHHSNLSWSGNEGRANELQPGHMPGHRNHKASDYSLTWGGLSTNPQAKKGCKYPQEVISEEIHSK
jgi:hypothetical protein